MREKRVVKKREERYKKNDGEERKTHTHTLLPSYNTDNKVKGSLSIQINDSVFISIIIYYTFYVAGVSCNKIS